MPLLNTVKRLTFKHPDGSKGAVRVEVVPMTRELVDIWTLEVQPVIDSKYSTSAPGLENSQIRADVNWKWGRYFRFHQAMNSVGKHGILRTNLGPTVAYCLVVKTVEGHQFPIGMLLAHPNYNCVVSGVRSRRAFTWYLADAPAETYGKSLNQHPPVLGVAMALIDTTIQISLKHGLKGEMLLHASCRGGDKLIEFYRDRCKMIQLDSDDPAVSFGRSFQSRERFFYMDSELAMEFSGRSDVYRTAKPVQLVAQV
ncbi:hypothetical protein [Pseudomonas shirazensis]